MISQQSLSDFKQILTRIYDLTQIDLQHKKPNQLFLSLAEEYGELAREILIEEKIFGNIYKQIDEGVKGEAVDVFICALVMYFANNGKLKSLKDSIYRFTDKFNHNLSCDIISTFNYASRNLSGSQFFDGDALSLSNDMLHIYIVRGGTAEEFTQYANKKLDKWQEKQQITSLY